MHKFFNSSLFIIKMRKIHFKLIFQAFFAHIVILHCTLFPYFGYYGLSYRAHQSSTSYCIQNFQNFSACINPSEMISVFSNNIIFVRSRVYQQLHYSLLLKSLVYFLSSNPSNQIKSSNNDNHDLVEQMWSSQPEIIKNISSNQIKSINSCFQSIYNVINGIFCAFVSKSQFDYMIVNDTYTPIYMALNFSDTGSVLGKCLPQIDYYCTLSYGVSIQTANPIFNFSFDFSNGRISKTKCLDLQNNWRCSIYGSDHSNQNQNCTDQIHQILNKMISTNFIDFSPSKSFSDSLGKLFNFTINLNDWTKVQAELLSNEIPSSRGIGIYFSTDSNGLAVYQFGLHSGGGNPVWDINKSYLMQKFFLFFFLIFFQGNNS